MTHVSYQVVSTALIAGWLATSSVANADDSEKKTGKNYAITVKANPSQVTSNAEAAMLVNITPKPGWTLKTETPFKANLMCSDGIELGKKTLGVDDFVDPESASKTVKAPFKATAAGQQSIDADLVFFLCNPELCKRHKDKIQLKMQVK